MSLIIYCSSKYLWLLRLLVWEMAHFFFLSALIVFLPGKQLSFFEKHDCEFASNEILWRFQVVYCFYFSFRHLELSASSPIHIYISDRFEKQPSLNHMSASAKDISRRSQTLPTGPLQLKQIFEEEGKEISETTAPFLKTLSKFSENGHVAISTSVSDLKFQEEFEKDISTNSEQKQTASFSASGDRLRALLNCSRFSSLLLCLFFYPKVQRESLQILQSKLQECISQRSKRGKQQPI